MFYACKCRSSLGVMRVLKASARTKDIPGTLRPDNVTGSSLLLRWNSLQAEQPPSLISVQYKEVSLHYETLMY